MEDATGRELTARLEVLSTDQLAVRVADANATYPVRIDPTFSDADWVSSGSGMGGGSSPYYIPYVIAVAVIGTNLYAGGGFTTAGAVPANYIAKWDGSAWSALGSGVNSAVEALAVSGTNLYAGGGFTTAGAVPANYIAKWDGSAWSALGSGISGNGQLGETYVNALAVSGTDLYAGGSFTTAGGVVADNIAKWNGSAWSVLSSGMGGSSYTRCHGAGSERARSLRWGLLHHGGRGGGQKHRQMGRQCLVGLGLGDQWVISGFLLYGCICVGGAWDRSLRGGML